MVENKSLTTGQAARYCQVSQATIINWIKGGKLKAYATPGGHHRIRMDDFLSFLETYQIPVDSRLKASARPQVLVVGNSPQADMIAQALEASQVYDVTLASSDHEAGAQVARLSPQAVILDLKSTDLDWAALCQWLRASPGEDVFSILAVGDAGDEQAARKAGVDAYLPGFAISARLPLELKALLDQDGSSASSR